MRSDSLTQVLAASLFKSPVSRGRVWIWIPTVLRGWRLVRRIANCANLAQENSAGTGASRDRGPWSTLSISTSASSTKGRSWPRTWRTSRRSSEPRATSRPRSIPTGSSSNSGASSRSSARRTAARRRPSPSLPSRSRPGSTGRSRACALSPRRLIAKRASSPEQLSGDGRGHGEGDAQAQ